MFEDLPEHFQRVEEDRTPAPHPATWRTIAELGAIIAVCWLALIGAVTVADWVL